MVPRAILLVLAVFAAHAQDAGFEVASVKVNRSGDFWFRITPLQAKAARFNATNISLQRLLLTAYGLEASMLQGGPDWLNADKFDIDAKGGKASSTGDILENLQALLRERFQLKTHWVSKEMPVYWLTVSKGGSKLHETACPPEQDGSQPCGGFRFAAGGIHAQNTSVASLCRALTDITGRPVVDQSGLPGRYDFVLKFVARIGLRGGEQMIDDGRDDSSSIFNALPEQLGVKLVSGKGTVRQLVIDHAERPSAN